MKKTAAVSFSILCLGILIACSSTPGSGSGEVSPSGIIVEKNSNIPGLVKLIRNPDRGYNYDAYIWLPSSFGPDDIHRLLVTPNNSGSSDDLLKFHDSKALHAILNNWEYGVAKDLNVPHLMPVFPRPRTDWHLYTHSLDRDTLAISDGKLKRIDLQLLAMIDDTREYLARQHGIALKEQFFLSGFSASGTFVNRFTVLHPERVRAVACGGVNSIPILPIETYRGRSLPYHIGIANLEKHTGRTFNPAAWREVAQYIYMGELDSNDTTLYDDGFTRDEAHLVWDTVGKDMAVRWQNCIDVYMENTDHAQLVTYLGIGHQPVVKDMAAFLRENADGGFTPIDQSQPAESHTNE